MEKTLRAHYAEMPDPENPGVMIPDPERTGSLRRREKPENLINRSNSISENLWIPERVF